MEIKSYFSQDRSYYRWLVLGNVILTTFMAATSAVSTIIAGDAIQGELALSDTLSIWVTTLYLLSLNITVPTANWFADHYGNIRIYSLGVLFFTIGAGFGGFAGDFYFLAIARVLEGIGAGLIFPIGLALIAKNFPGPKLPLAMNLYLGLGFGGGFGIGMYISGYLTQFHSWREIFLLFIPFGLLASISCWLSRKTIPDKERIPFDLWGFLLISLFISSLLVALTLGPIPSTAEGWRSPFIIGCLVLAIVSLIGAFFIEKSHPYPLIRLPLFKDLVFTVSTIAMFVLGMSLFGTLGTATDYMLHGLFYEKYVSGKLCMIFGVTMGIFSMLTSLLIKFIPTPLLTLLGLSILVFSYFLNNEMSWLTGPSQLIPLLFLRGMGLGLSLGPVTIQAIREIPREFASSAATLLTFVRQIGGTYGGTILSIFTIRRKIFHATRFGEQVALQTTGYQETFRNLYEKFSTQIPDKGFEGAAAKATIIKNIETQAFIQAQNDSMIVFGYITAAVAILLLILNVHRYLANRRKSALDH